jgi:hypothetical protein
MTMRRGIKLMSFVCAALCGMSLYAAAAQACPMCSQSIAEESLLPHAYMYSIIFMLAMPATVFTGFGTMIFLKFRKFNAEQQVGIAGDDLVTRRDESNSA